MPTQRLTFLYPHLFRTARLGESAASKGRSRRGQHAAPPSCQKSFGISTSASKSSFAPRVGKAIEPKPLGNVQGAPALESPPSTTNTAGTQEQPPPPPQEGGQQAQAGEAKESTPEQRKDAAKTLDPAADALKETLSSPGEASSSSTANDGSIESSKKKRATGPMDALLHIEPPEKIRDKDKPPHLSPPPYVHHFDSYSLVKQLEDGGFSQAQAITTMKAVRALLAQNLDVAQEGLVSKTDVDNETYLFRAACSELGTEVKNNQRVADEQMRQQRTVLQHEVDNTAQTLNQELATLSDNVRGMFSDRKMAVREEQKSAESQIQQITYKINVALNSDSKSEIEGVRWVLARRAVMGLVYMLIVSFATLRYGSYLDHQEQKEEKRKQDESETLRKNNGKEDQTASPDAAVILAAN